MPVREMRAGEARQAVIERDQGCMAPRLDPETSECRDQWGRPIPEHYHYALEVDRIREHPTMGKAPSHRDITHMVCLCSWHHQGGWATSHRPQLREYLRGLYPDVWG